MYPELVGRRGDLTRDSAGTDCAGLLGSYDLGKRLGDKRFQDAVLSRLVRCLKSDIEHKKAFVGGLTPFLVEKIIRLYSQKSPMYKLSVKAAAHFASMRQIGAFSTDGYPQGFLSDLLKELTLLREALQPILVLVEDECEFHLCREEGYRCLVPVR